MRHLYYSNPEGQDLSKYREDAAKRAQGDIRNAPEGTTIHYHNHNEECNNKVHETTEVK